VETKQELVITELFAKEMANEETTASDFLLLLRKSYAAHKQEKEKIKYLSHILASIQPDPIRAKICRSGCIGKGYRYIDVAVVKGEIHYKVDLCCGVVGSSPYALIDNKLTVLIETVNSHSQRLSEIDKKTSSEVIGLGKMLEQHDSCVVKQLYSIEKFQFIRKVMFWKH